MSKRASWSDYDAWVFHVLMMGNLQVDSTECPGVIQDQQGGTGKEYYGKYI